MDVVVCGAGPVGLMLSCELALADISVVVLEKRLENSVVPRANGIVGQPVRLLELRGLLAGFSAGRYAGPVPSYPFGDVLMDLSLIPDVRLPALLIPQPELERLLADRAVELGATIRRGHEVTAFSQSADRVTVQVRQDDDSYELSPRYLVGCDGGHSVVRQQAGIAFPGSADPEVLRMGHFRAPEAAGLYTNAGLDVPGFGRLQRGWNRTPRGAVLAMSLQPGVVIAGVREPGEAPRDKASLTLPELQASARRVLGGELPLGEPIWLSQVVVQGRLAQRYRDGRVFLAGDAAHLFPAGGALTVGLPDAVNLGWKLAAALIDRADLLDTYEAERRPIAKRALLQTRAQAALTQAAGDNGVALRELLGELLTYAGPLRHLVALMDGSDRRFDTIPGGHPLTGRFVPALPLKSFLRNGKPILLDLADRPAVRAIADGWPVEVVIRPYDARPTAALLVRPDGYVAWAGDERDLDGLHAAVARWCLPYPP
ncbi:FAD-dependent monooxygenase [Fodinicola feengrottensis]|uniref:FAD-dependent monooxygenase n=2 Tax=Fodinicola feengrottensis TaxID=435914 RepID=A0ABN2HVJ0_9ACTN